MLSITIGGYKMPNYRYHGEIITAATKKKAIKQIVESDFIPKIKKKRVINSLINLNLKDLT